LFSLSLLFPFLFLCAFLSTYFLVIEVITYVSLNHLKASYREHIQDIRYNEDNSKNAEHVPDAEHEYRK
jgi:hypothetical protein